MCFVKQAGFKGDLLDLIHAGSSTGLERRVSNTPPDKLETPTETGRSREKTGYVSGGSRCFVSQGGYTADTNSGYKS